MKGIRKWLRKVLERGRRGKRCGFSFTEQTVSSAEQLFGLSTGQNFWRCRKKEF